MSPTRSTLHRRISAFVDWIAPERDREDEIRAQAELVRNNLRGQAERDGLIVRSIPYSGSFAKRTGLRRHRPGGSRVDGLDVDLPFVLSPRTRDDEELHTLLDRFDRYAASSYPGVVRSRTKCSVKLEFVRTKLNYDIVPMLATSVPDEQIIIRGDETRLRTSIQKHVEFIRGRTRVSNDLSGRVKFNEVVRLFKWWREFREESATFEVPTIVIDLLAAAAFDAQKVEATYHDTLAGWFGWLTHAVKTRQRLAFQDFVALPAPNGAAVWEVLDPVNPENNVVGRWSRLQVEQLAGWLGDARDAMHRAIRADALGNDRESLSHLVGLFGSPFKHYCGD
ncbi:MAG: CBASS oligonucleotide cyclase [Pseudomonadota bacterium]|nr:CBASS oligonucleotide cyclase [Pseudomonadota bacterium]